MYPIIHIKGLNIYQGDKLVLKNINFNIHRGEFIFLIGKTGSGKSSLLKTLYGELPCRFGKVQVAEFSLHTIIPTQLPFLRRKLGIIFQDFQLLMDRTVEENLAFVLKATGWKQKTDIKNRVAEVLMKVGLDWAGKKMPYQLSGGEQQRTAVARALLNDPVLLLADEPTGNLDPEVANEILNLFLEINKAGTAVLMATHNYDFLDKQHSRVLKCEDGYLLDTLPQADINLNIPNF
ncbi:MAG: cell division ATP-binding protein FtsE [Candidatus Amoebophilus sp.]